MADLDSSTDMFEDTSPPSERDWRGSPLEELTPRNICTYPAVRSTSNHTVLFKLPIPHQGSLEPHPSRPADKWDSDHVRMPHSRQNLFPVSECELTSRWQIIREALSQPINRSEDLEQAIVSYYNIRGSDSGLTFDALHTFFNVTLEKEEATYVFRKLMPNIINLALEIEDKFRGALPILKRGANRSVTMSQMQAGVLLANAFLCTFPCRNSSSHQSVLPSINFSKLFQCGSLPVTQQKLKCFMNYFRRILRNRPTGVLTYTRRHLRRCELPTWSTSEAKFNRVHIASSGTIEDKGGGMMEIDFANKFVGGGVLGRGSVQEEIRFLICPELVVARLFCESLEDTEALIVTGCERFSDYEGYGETFSWSGNYDDCQRPRDSSRRFNTIVVAIDAIYNIRQSDQFKPDMIKREINKAYAGFSFGQDGAIATGNWGCGAFKGDPLLKFVIQLMAASECGKPLAYFTFGDDRLRDTLFEMHDFLTRKNVTVGALWKVVRAYCASSDVGKKSGQGLFGHIYRTLNPVCTDPASEPMECSEDSPSSGNKRKYENRDSDCSKSPQESKRPNDLEIPQKDLPSNSRSMRESNEKVSKESLVRIDATPESSEDPSDKKRSDSVKGIASEKQPTIFYSDLNSSKKFVPKRPFKDIQCPSNKTSPPGVENLTIAPKNVVVKNSLVNGCVTKKMSLKSETPRFSLDESTDDIFSQDASHRLSVKAEPVTAETCSLTTEEGRRKCLASDQQRWDAYQSAMSKFGSETKIVATSPNSSQSSIRTPKGPTKRKISDYFPKATPSPR